MIYFHLYVLFSMHAWVGQSFHKSYKVDFKNLYQYFQLRGLTKLAMIEQLAVYNYTYMGTCDLHCVSDATSSMS